MQNLQIIKVFLLPFFSLVKTKQLMQTNDFLYYKHFVLYIIMKQMTFKSKKSRSAARKHADKCIYSAFLSFLFQLPDIRHVVIFTAA